MTISPWSRRFSFAPIHVTCRSGRQHIHYRSDSQAIRSIGLATMTASCVHPVPLAHFFGCRYVDLTSKLIVMLPRVTRPASLLTKRRCTVKSRTLSDTPLGSNSKPIDASKLSRELTEFSEQGMGFEAIVKHLSESSREQIHQAMLAARAASKNMTVPEPTPQDLRAVAIATCIPFIAFGIMDNALLIIAGDAIDTSFGVLLGISTMCAAALVRINVELEEWRLIAL